MALTATTTAAIRFFRVHAAVIRVVLGELSPSLLLRSLFFTVLATSASLEAIRFEIVERPGDGVQVWEKADPVVASVGDEVLRMSDAMAHASFIGAEQPGDIGRLYQSGTLEDAVDHLALAEAAKQEGLAEATEIRAALALAERQILAEAYLERVISEAVTEEAILEEYRRETRQLTQNSVMRLAHLVVPTREEAEALKARLPGGDFAELARTQSMDEATKSRGGLIGEVRSSELDPRLAEAVRGLGIGEVSEAVETEVGWHLVKLEARRAWRLPPLSERRPAIEEELRIEALAEALDGARSRIPVRLRDPSAVAADQQAVAGSVAALTGG